LVHNRSTEKNSVGRALEILLEGGQITREIIGGGFNDQVQKVKRDDA